MIYFSSFVLLLALVTGIQAVCSDPSPAFPLLKFPAYNQSAILKDAFKGIAASLEKLLSQPAHNISSFSIEVTTSEEHLWELHHTARDKDPARPGAKKVNGNSIYRMASVTKAFTTLAIIKQHIAGNLSIDDAIDKYLDLRGDIPWKDITLRTVASQLSGIPREFAQADIVNMFPDPSTMGLPPATWKDLPECDEYFGYERPCTGKDLLADLARKQPLWPPKQQSTYSNVNFDLLGLVIENVTGLSYSDYVDESILQELGMSSSSFTAPNDSVAVLPRGENYWDVEEGVQRPTGGLYSSSSDMSKFVRYVLTSYNGLSPQFNWFNPGSYSTTLSSFYGMPWEIFRTASILPSTSRPTTFVTKAGGLPGYFTIIIMIPEYDLGVTILTATESSALLDQIRETVTVPLVRAAENIAQSVLSARYTGVFAAKDINSTLVLAQANNKSLHIESFISNSTDILATWLNLLDAFTLGRPFRIQLVPTLLYRDEKAHKGELWRGIIVIEGPNPGEIWDDFCLTNMDMIYYDGKPLFEVVFWGGEDGGEIVEKVELSGFKVTLGRVTERSKSGDDISGSGNVLNSGQQDMAWEKQQPPHQIVFDNA